MPQPLSGTVIVKTLRRLHADRSADMVQKILIIACIALPILVILLTFKTKIIEWFEQESEKVEGART